MKKLLLSSIIMFAVCGYATAQNATGSKFQKAGTTTTSVAPTPQKAAVTNEVISQPEPASDKATQAAVPAANDKAAKVRNTAVSADGVVVSTNDVSSDEAKKAAAAKAAAAKKNKEN